MIADSKVSSVTVIAHLPGNIYLYFGKWKENFRVCEKNVKKNKEPMQASAPRKNIRFLIFFTDYR